MCDTLLELPKCSCSSQMEVYVNDTYVNVGGSGCVQDVTCLDLPALLQCKHVCICEYVSHYVSVNCGSRGVHTCLTLSSMYAESWPSCFTVTALFLHTVYSFTPLFSTNQLLPLPSIIVFLCLIFLDFLFPSDFPLCYTDSPCGCICGMFRCVCTWPLLCSFDQPVMFACV